MSESKRATRLWIMTPLLLAVLIALMLISLTLGRYSLNVTAVARILLTGSFSAPHLFSDIPHVIVLLVRLPRVLLVLVCGMGLGLSGAVLQGVFRNPLVGPDIVGVSSGASFGGVIAIAMGWSATATIALAFIVGLGAFAVASALAASAARAGALALVLAGMVVAALFSALVGLVQYFADPTTDLPAIVYWLLGSFANANYAQVALASMVTLPAGAALIGMRWRLNLLSLGNTDARALGLNVSAFRWVMVALVALPVAAQVCVSGGMGWVGLIVPHLTRFLVGPDHARLIPTSALVGGIFLLAIDDLARTLTPQEIPIGLLSALIGAPVFGFLVWRSRSLGWNRE